MVGRADDVEEISERQLCSERLVQDSDRMYLMVENLFIEKFSSCADVYA